MADEIVRALLEVGNARVVACVTTETAREAARRHHAIGASAVALARGATAGLLLATLTKGGERVTLQVLGDGPLGGLGVDANDAGEVRAYVRRAGAFSWEPGKQVSLAAAVGQGTVNVLRDLGLKETYGGTSPILTGEIDEDVAAYLTLSEQIQSALGCDAILDERGEVVASAGILVQELPHGAPHVVQAAKRHLNDLFERMKALHEGPGLTAAGLLAAFAPDARVVDTRPVRFHCPCTAARVAGALSLLGPEELDAMIREQGGAEVTCNFCGEVYRLTTADLAALRDGKSLRGDST